MNAFQNFAMQRYQESEGIPITSMNQAPGGQTPSQSALLQQAMNDMILLGACGVKEILPQNAALPADLFTSCLTTPIKVALRWFCDRSLLKHEGLNLDMIDRVPGKQTDRKTLLGELNWIFTAITDTIAWNILPRPLFQKLFRQDLLVASLFRNFLLAERIMRAFGCMPLSYPTLPPTHQHPMWHAWDLAAETCLAQLPGLLSGDPSIEYVPSAFFTEQLTAFEVWLEHGSRHKPPPEQLPIVLQVLLSQSHRLRALVLLGRFLDMGTWAVELALSVGIFPYVLKLLQTTANELRQILVFIWTKILALDQSCKNDLTKDTSFLYFIKFLESSDASSPPESKAGAAFILSVICHDHPKGQKVCASAQLMDVCLSALHSSPSNLVSGSSTLLAQWLCLCLGKLWENSFELSIAALNVGVQEKLSVLLGSASAKVRASAVFALGSLVSLVKNAKTFEEAREEISEHVRDPKRLASERIVAGILLSCAGDGSALVRKEVIHALGRFASAHNTFIDIAHQACEGLGGSSRGPHHRRGGSTLSDSLDDSSYDEDNHSAPTMKRAQIGGDATNAVREAGSKGSGSLGSENRHHPPTISGVNGGPSGEVSGKPNIPVDQGFTYSQLYQNVLGTIVTANFDPSPKVASAARHVLEVCSFQVVMTFKDRPKSVPTQTAGKVAFSPQRRHNFRSKLASSLSFSSERLASLNASPSNSFTSPQSFSRQKSHNKHDSFRSVSMALSDCFSIIKTSTDQKDHIECRIIPPNFSTSDIFSVSCKYFASPILTAQSELAMQAEHHTPWCELIDPSMVVDRQHRMEESFSISRNIRPQGLDHQLALIETGGADNSITALVFDPVDDLLHLADAKGSVMVRRVNGSQLNCFNVQRNVDSRWQAATAHRISHMAVLNAEHDPLLLTSTIDGSISVFRNHKKRGCEQQATSWMAVPRPWRGTMLPAIIETNAASKRLYASGCSTPKMIHVWDMLREMCVEQMSTIDNVSCMYCAPEGQPSLLVGADTGSVFYYDMRDPRNYMALSEPYDKPLAGLAFVNNDTQVVAGYSNGVIKLFDIRAGTLGKLKNLEGHDSVRSKMLSFAGHRCGTLFATSSAHSIKVWNMECQLLSVAKPHGNFLPRSGSSINTLAFHPTKHILAAGGADSTVSVYCSYG